jgi:WD40 repeat protein
MPSSAGYDAFISYNRRQDAWLAPALQVGLERFAKPWHQVRALRVFRDTASLAASPELWGSVEEALRASRWFILLASPEAARSEWVDREVAWWLANRSADQLLIVATAERLRWDKDTGDWAQGAPVPPSLRGTLRAEPLWVDLTGRQGDAKQVRIPDEALATLAAALRGIDRDTLIGEHLRQHRRTMRAVRTVVATLTVLLLLAVAATIVAFGQRNAARTESRIATARELAALSGTLLGTNLDVAQLLAVGAYQTDRNTQTESALLQAATASPYLARFLQVGATVTALASSSDGKTLVAGTADGHLVWFDLATRHHAEVRATARSVTGLSVSADGHMVAAADAVQAVAWSPGAPRVVHVKTASPPAAVSISPSGRLIAVLEKTTTQTPRLVLRAADGSERSVPVSFTYDELGFPSDASIVLADDHGARQMRDAPSLSLRAAAASDPFTAPAGDYLAGMSGDGAYAGSVGYGVVAVWRTSSTAHAAGGQASTVPASPASAFAIRADAQEAAVAESGTIYITRLIASSRSPYDILRTSGTLPSGGIAAQLTGGGDTDLVTFIGTSGQLASASGATIALWNTSQLPRLAAPTGISVPFDSLGGTPPFLLAPPDGTWLSLVGGQGTGASLIRTGHQPEKPAGQGIKWFLPMSVGDELLLIGAEGNDLVLAHGDGKVIQSWPGQMQNAGTTAPLPVAAGMLPGRKQFALVRDDESIRLYDIQAGTVRNLPGSGLPPKISITSQETALSLNGRVVVVAGATNTLPPEPVPVKYMDLRTGITYQVGVGGALGVQFGRDSLIIERPTGEVEVWDMAGRKRLHTWPGTAEDTGELAVSPDGTMLARLRQDGTVSLTDITTGNILATFTLPPATAIQDPDPWSKTAMLFTPDGHSLLTATSGGQLIRWTVDPPDLVRNICTTAGRTLTDTQWSQYTGTRPPATKPCAS